MTSPGEAGGTAAFTERVRALYGADFARPAGVVHVTSVWVAPGGVWRSIRIGPDAPASATDAFVLAAARARADAIVTTGAILRAEPRLSLALRPDAAAWRRDVLARPQPPLSVVLTRGAQLDFGHPLFDDAAPVAVSTQPEAARRLGGRAASLGNVRVVPHAVHGLRGTLAWLADEEGCETILVEAGVSASAELYDEPLAVDELLLSLFCAGSLARAAQGAPFLAPEHPVRQELERHGPARCVERNEPSGPWRFERHRLRALE